jgi:hypothetical protein
VALDPTDLLRGVSERAQAGVNGIWGNRQAEMPWNLAATSQRAVPGGSMAPFATSYPGGGLAPYNSGYTGGSLAPFSGGYSGGSLAPFSGGYAGGSLAPFSSGYGGATDGFGGVGLAPATGFDSPYATPQVKTQGSTASTSTPGSGGSSSVSKGQDPFKTKINAGPSLSRAQTIKVGQEIGLTSDEAGYLYDAGVKAGIDPGFALAIIKHEGNVHNPNNNMFDIQGGDGVTPVPAGDNSRWGAYASHQAAIDAFFELLTKHYLPNGQDTVGTVMHGPGSTMTSNTSNAYGPGGPENDWNYPQFITDDMGGWSDTQAAASTGNGSIKDRVSQFDQSVPAQDRALACGPTSVAAFVNSVTGSSFSPGDMFNKAVADGSWRNGEAQGPEEMARLARENGAATAHTAGVSDATIQAQLAAGRPVIIDTPGHYFYVTGFDPKTGRYELGTSASDIIASGGRTQYSLSEIGSLGMGSPRALIVA